MDMQKNIRVNREHKDSLFRFIFSDKKALLSLYNAVNDSDYTDKELLEIYTMEDFVYMGMKNDVSFLIDWNLNLFEHQSTYNPNMPLRGFMYMASSFKKYVELNRLDLYSSKLIRIPVPRYFVFYNGKRPMEDEVLFRLTDQMEGTDAAEKSCTEFTAHMVNINEGHSPKMMERCPMLYEYSIFIGEIRKNTEAGMMLVEAIDTAVDECIKRGILADILRSNRAEVTDMLLKEYDEAFHIASEKEISFEEGRQLERANTEKERQRAEEERNRAEAEKNRAEKEKNKAQEEKKRADKEKQRADEVELKNKILIARLRGETVEKIAENLGVDADQVQKVLNNI